MFTPGSRACAYKTASGRGEWPNQDPINELGFNLLIQSRHAFNWDEEKNLYGFVGNSPAGSVDPYGLLSLSVYLACARLPGWDFAECICLGAPDEEECVDRLGGCLNLIGGKLQDVGAMCDCLCEGLHPDDCDARDDCKEKCNKQKRSQDLFDRYKKRNTI
jgi:hypothetical protein